MMAKKLNDNKRAAAAEHARLYALLKHIIPVLMLSSTDFDLLPMLLLPCHLGRPNRTGSG
jgi:hypothetical protein